LLLAAAGYVLLAPQSHDVTLAAQIALPPEESAEPAEASEPPAAEPAGVETPPEPAAEPQAQEAAPSEETTAPATASTEAPQSPEAQPALSLPEPAAETTASPTEEQQALAGLPPWQRYRTEIAVPEGRPRIAVVVTGLGLSAAATEAAIKQLPPAITLSFSPYARQLNEWIALARVHDHEVMLDLPLEPVTYPEDDPGPHALLTVLDKQQNLERLDWLLARGNSYVGVAAVMGSRFTASVEHLEPVLAALKERGLMFLDNRASEQSAVDKLARAIDLPHAINDTALDNVQASRLAINARLSEVERVAQEHGVAVAMGQPYPVTIERLRDWSSTLGQRGYALVPITALAEAKP